MVSNKWLVLWSLWAARLVPHPTPPVLVTNGWLRGSVAPDGSFVQYTGIPYATVPFRFQGPGPEPKWEGVKDAVDEHIVCIQSVSDIIKRGQQECLILNVYTPLNTPSNANLPVMVYIHGGGYYQGSSSMFLYGPQYLIAKDVILVTINYRLNIQGFLCLRIKEAPGNGGYKDQVAALKWVQRNIRKFGGDPDTVTLFGESAGAASVSYQLMSPMSEGLFHRAILQSGSSLGAWAFQFNPIYLASLLAKVMLKETNDSRELYDLFMTKSDAELVTTRVPRQKGNIVITEILYSACAEAPIDGVEPFLTESPYDMLSQGKFKNIPVMVGANSEEGLLLISMDNTTMIRKVEFDKALPKDLHIPSEEVRKEIGEKLKQFYVGDDLTDEVGLSKLYGEPHITYPALQETELIAKSNEAPVFSYIFNYSGRRNAAKIYLRSPLNVPDGGTHADELFYLFSQQVHPSFFETEFIDKMTTLWTNFAKFGDPTPVTTNMLPVKWPRVQHSSPQSLVLDKEFSLTPMWYTESLKYLREVYAKYRRQR